MAPACSPSRALRTCVALALFLAASSATMPSVAAQNLSCLNCDMELVVVEWNGSALPGTVVSGIFEVRNTGESTDSYRITATPDNASWTANTDVESGSTGDVPPGAGLFAADDNTFGFQVALLVPEDAPASGSVTITVEAASENDDDLAKSVTVEARAKQTYGWTLDCTPLATAEKSKSTLVELTATNNGNGRDRATVAYTPVEGLVVSDPKAFELAAGRQQTQSVEIGVGLRAEDGIEDLRWDLRSRGDPELLAQCITAFEVAGVSPEPTDDDNQEEESPPAALMPTLLALGCVLFLRRRRA